jgi:hypothetical protein
MKIARYWDLSIPAQPSATASGLYVATDPVISRAFGGTGNVWAAIEMVLDTGFRFVDVRRWPDERANNQKFPPALFSLLQQTGCKVEFPATLLTTLESESCRSIAVRVARKLRVDGILQDFQVKTLEPCPDRWQGGFIVLSSEHVPDDRIRVFVAESDSPERLRIHDMFVRARRAGSRMPLPWRDLTLEDTATGMDAWMYENIFGCGVHEEDRIADGVFQPSAEALYQNARELANRDQTQEAIQQYGAVLAADPDFVPALDELAWILATSADASCRKPAEAERLAGHLVELTHYKFRRTTWGMFAKEYKIHASHTLAAAFAANGNFERATGYAIQSLETAQRLQEVEPSATVERLIADGREYLKLYESHRPLIAPAGFRRTPVAMH